MIPPEPSRPGHHRARRRRRFRPVLSTLVGFGLAGVVGILAAVGLILGGPPSAGTTRSVLAQEAADTQKALVSARPTTRAGHLRATRLDEVKLLLDKQAEAILASDKRTYLSTIDPAESNRAFAAAAERTFDNLVRMRVVSFGFDRIAEDPGGLTPQRQRALGAAALVVEATMRFRVPGVDYRNVWTTPLRMVFVERDGRIYLAGDSEGESSTSPRPLWLVDRVSVLRGERSLVIGAGPASRLEAYVDAADRAVPRVSEVWGEAERRTGGDRAGGEWQEYVVLVVPRTQAQMERAIGAEPGSQDQVAAVTTSVGRGDPEHASHIVVNPSTFAELGALGRLVVLTHETTHVATHATVSGMPMWLSEGFADYVGFRRAGLAARSVAKHLLAQVRETGPPESLPDAAAFDPRNEGLDHAYESAWTACRYIAERWGQRTLVRFYAAMNGISGSAQEAAVFEQVLGITKAQFLQDWRAYVADLAATG